MYIFVEHNFMDRCDLCDYGKDGHCTLKVRDKPCQGRVSGKIGYLRDIKIDYSKLDVTKNNPILD